ETVMPDYIEGVKKIVEIAVQEYINKKDRYEDLYIYFGCTGGRHRSVYSAQTIVMHIKNKVEEEIELKHLQLIDEKRI
ncbi:MAG: RapZ C-terminal domain-containing protein, partial [Minisyncoccia bacterium]